METKPNLNEFIIKGLYEKQPKIEKFEIRDLILQNIKVKHFSDDISVDIPSLDDTLTIIFGFGPSCHIGKLYSETASCEISKFYLKKLYDNRYIKHWVDNSNFELTNRKKREGKITIEGRVLSYSE